MKTERKARVLVIDDEENIRKSLKMILEYEGFQFLEAGDGEDGLRTIDETPGLDIVLLDIKMPGRDGLDILKDIKAKPFSPEVIMISGQGTIHTAVEATKRGAFEFLEKPLHRDRVLLTIRNALTQNSLARENIDLRHKAEKRYELIGNHPLMKKLWKEIQSAAPTNATVLIYGESGTGKELIARAVHAQSLRAKEAFVQVNCAAIPEELIESELFGHEKGSFTGATERKTGKFEQADAGTIFLDEIGDMSLKTQSKVLRVLEEGEVQKVGSSKINKVDVRVIAATNKDLKKEIEKGGFRDDLYFRLNVLPLYSPALREKKEDIPLLVDYFSRRFADENNFRARGFHPRGHGGDDEGPLEGQHPRAAQRGRAAPDHGRQGRHRPQGSAREHPRRPRPVHARAGQDQDPQGLPRPSREGVHPGQAGEQRLEHLADRPRDRHAPLQPVQEAGAVRHQDHGRCRGSRRAGGRARSQDGLRPGRTEAGRRDFALRPRLWYNGGGWSRCGGCFRGPARGARERKVRTPQGRMVANGDSGRPGESATEKTPPARARVKRRGKSSPPRWRHRGQGKPHPEQGQTAPYGTARSGGGSAA